MIQEGGPRRRQTVFKGRSPNQNIQQRSDLTETLERVWRGCGIEDHRRPGQLRHHIFEKL
jgi:hypothetical protein